MVDTVQDATELVQKLVDLKGRASNRDLRGALKWEEDRYFDARNHARAEGLIGLQRGRGGFVVLSDFTRGELGLPLSAVPGEEARLEADLAKESEYYGKIASTLRDDWAQEEGYDDWVVEVTANKRVRKSGRWAVPDIVLVSKIVRQYVPSFDFAVQTFEVKRFEALDATAVFEALNHQRSAHYSYLVVANAPKKPTERERNLTNEIAQLCGDHNVGLISICKGDEATYELWTFEEVIDVRNEPEPDNVESFIKQYMSPDSKDKIAKMVR